MTRAWKRVTPRLLLLTGPAAGDVAAVLRAATPAADPRQGASCDPWDEVRDYWEAPGKIADEGSLDPCGYSDKTACEAAIRSLPGGEEWLVGLVLPGAKIIGPKMDGNHQYLRWGIGACRSEGLPVRLAILASDPPPLLVERVRAWGGDCWHLRSYDDGWCYITFEDGGSIRQMSWPEAVRAALEEAL